MDEEWRVLEPGGLLNMGAVMGSFKMKKELKEWFILHLAQSVSEMSKWVQLSPEGLEKFKE